MTGRLGRTRRRIAGGRPWADRGSVTIEAAVALTSIVLVVVLCVAGIGCLIAALRAADAAGVAARLAARGDDAAARSAVRQLAPSGSVLTLSGGDLLTAHVAVPPLGGALPGVRIGASAVAAREPGTAPP